MNRTRFALFAISAIIAIPAGKLIGALFTAEIEAPADAIIKAAAARIDANSNATAEVAAQENKLAQGKFDRINRELDARRDNYLQDCYENRRFGYQQLENAQKEMSSRQGLIECFRNRAPYEADRCLQLIAEIKPLIAKIQNQLLRADNEGPSALVRDDISRLDSLIAQFNKANNEFVDAARDR